MTIFVKQVSNRKALSLLAPLALLALGACTTPFRADVQRFVALPDTTGQSFAVVAADPDLSGGLEFGQYAMLVEQRMLDLGYRRSDDPAAAELIVSMDYDIVYTSELDLKIDRAVDGQRLFEGKAEALSRSKNLTYLVPNLVEAMFTNFPGNSGERVRISVAPE